MKKTLIALAAVATLVLSACGTDSEIVPPTQGGTPEESATPTPVETDAAEPGLAAEATVFAAASLVDVFPLIVDGAAYSFDGSSGLVDQLVGGAPADVFASADQKNMDRAVDEGVIAGDPVMFATNYLVLVVPAGNPAGVTGFDESLDGAKLVVCAADVPCGAATARVAEANDLTLSPVSEEANVRDVLGKITSGEGDAGLVYMTDATSAADAVEIFDVPGAADDPNTYWIAVVKDAPNPAAAQTFIDAVMGPGAATLADFGFGPAR